MKFKLSLFLLLPVLSSLSQKLTFDVFLFGNKIGQSVVEKIVRNDSITTYVLNSSSEAHIFFTTRKIGLHYDILYKRNQFISSWSKSTRNDEVHITTIQWQNGAYTMKRDDGTFCIKPPVDCSTIKLFFEEPCGGGQIFSERLGEYRPVKKTGPGTFEAEMKDGLTYIYRYKDGKLAELEMRKGVLGSVFLRPAIK